MPRRSVLGDFARFYRFHQAGSFFVTRAKKNMDAQRRYSHPVDRTTGVIFDQTLVLQGYQFAKDYPESLRGIRYKDPETGRQLLFITNNTALPALKICALYKARWQVELFVSLDQAASEDKVVLRDLRERCEVADLDHRVGLRARRHRQEAACSVAQPLRNPTDSQPQPVRENPNGCSTYAHSGSVRTALGGQPADSLRLTLGQTCSAAAG
jgi:hypothetical protein